MKNDKLILNDILSKVLTTLERGYMEATMEYHYANDDSALNDVISSHNDFVIFFGKRALITREDKFKTLLKSCGYKRRTEKLVLRINRSLEKLKLECSLKCRKKCNIRKIDLDDMIIIRLKENS